MKAALSAVTAILLQRGYLYKTGHLSISHFLQPPVHFLFFFRHLISIAGKSFLHDISLRFSRLTVGIVRTTRFRDEW